MLVIDGLKVETKILKGFSKQPKNANVLNQIINEQSINYAIEMSQPRKVYRFQVKRLPSEIHPDKTSIKVSRISFFKSLFIKMDYLKIKKYFFKYDKDRVVITLIKRNTDTWRTFADSDFETAHLVKN